MSDNLATMFVTALLDLNNKMVSALKRVQDSFTSSTSSTIIQYVIWIELSQAVHVVDGKLLLSESDFKVEWMS